MVNILDWKSKYIATAILDGTHWSVEIFSNSRKIRKCGENRFPKEWNLFSSSIKHITGNGFN